MLSKYAKAYHPKFRWSKCDNSSCKNGEEASIVNLYCKLINFSGWHIGDDLGFVTIRSIFSTFILLTILR